MKYWVVTGAAAVLALLLSWTPLASQFDNDAYDWMSRLFRVDGSTPEAVVVAIDETTLQARGGIPGVRGVLTELLEQMVANPPRVIAIDFTLADAFDHDGDARLAAAMANVSNLILGTDIAQDGSGWQDPRPEFARAAKALGHTHADPDPVCRWIQLDKAAGRSRRWAMGLEALAPGVTPHEDGSAIQWAGHAIPSHRVRIVFTNAIPQMSASNFDPERLRGKAVFIGTTALTAARDRLMTPLGDMKPGVEIHAELFETLRTSRFRTDPPASLLLLFQVALAALAVIAIRKFGYWAGAGVLIVAHSLPFLLFPRGTVLPMFSIALTTWLPALTAATLHFRSTRRDLARAEADRGRYQQAIHWVTHEMRTPLTAIQGSSELMTRYSLPAEKQKQIADMINAESKRLAQMIQAFLDVERLSAGQMQLKREPFLAADVLDSCIRRVVPLAERKQQRIVAGALPDALLHGDRELMEFAVYNLLTNAVKYSPERTEIQISAQRENHFLRLAVQDQGMGIEEKDLARLGTRFFRTRRAEESGIQGTGIGLSIVREIVTRHGGRLEVASRIGEGSCFTIVMPASVQAEVAAPK